MRPSFSSATLLLWLFLLACRRLSATDTCSCQQSCVARNRHATPSFSMQNVAYLLRTDTKMQNFFVDYTHPVYKKNVRVEVPNFFVDYPRERMAREMDHYVENSGMWSERVLLEIFYHAVDPELGPGDCGGLTDWLSNMDYCEWEGITCGSLDDSGLVVPDPLGVEHYKPPPNAVTRIDLMERGLRGTLPSSIIYLNHLHHLNLNDNKLKGSIPTEFGDFLRLRFLDLGGNKLTGSIPRELGHLSPTLEELWLEKNQLSGPIHYQALELPLLRFLDLSENKLTGSMPPELGALTNLQSLFLEENKLTGTIIPEIGFLSNLRVMDIGVNDFTGPIPAEIGLCTSLMDFNVASNRLNESIPLDLFRLTNLEVVMLGENDLTGSLPPGDDEVPRIIETDNDDEEPYEFKWSDLKHLVAFAMDRNNILGPLPPGFLYGLAPTLTSLDIGYNFFTGTVPPELAKMSRLKRLSVPYNFFTGPVPSELTKMKELVSLNLTANLFTGTVPKALCGAPIVDSSIADEFGCDAVLCPPGTFQPDGAASLMGGCQKCPKTKVAEDFTPPLSTVLGRSSCESAPFIYGDLDSDGKVSPNEALRLLYFQTAGPNWGSRFQASWRNLKANECELTGVSCTNGKITKLDLSDAKLCANENGSAGDCAGLPGELRYLSDSLEALWLPRRVNLKGTIPSELGELTKLQYLELQSCQSMTGTIPSEIGQLTNLKHLDISGGEVNGTIPTELFRLSNLEKMNMSMTALSGTIGSEIGNLKNAKEIRLSRAYLNGTLPTTMGRLRNLENFEIYSNAISGSIPDEIGKCTSLKRIDMFNNKFTGTIPESLTNLRSLQILHFKRNQLTGTIPPNLGAEMPYLVWFDVSLNMLSGTISEAIASSRMLKDLRLHGNRLYDPIPESLCTHAKANSGRTSKYGCDAIICPIGTYSEHGFATDTVSCEKCPPGKTSMYLGSTECIELDQEDLLSMFYDVLDGDKWPEEYRKGWKEESTSVCQWAGVTCDEKKKVIGLSIPRSKA